MAKKVIDFGEEETEYDAATGEYVEVWQSPKYIESKKKAIDMIESEKYDLTDGDFWILKNKTKSGKIAYTGLIISHNGCLKINDNIDNKVNPKCFSLDKEGYKDSLVYTYIDEDVYEVGEFNSTNGKNPYPYAMAYKRCFDRVVLKKSKLAYSGIYSEVEADEFKQDMDAAEQEHLKLITEFNKLADEVNLNREALYEKLQVKNNSELSNKQLQDLIESMKKKKESK